MRCCAHLREVQAARVCAQAQAALHLAQRRAGRRHRGLPGAEGGADTLADSVVRRFEAFSSDSQHLSSALRNRRSVCFSVACTWLSCTLPPWPPPAPRLRLGCRPARRWRRSLRLAPHVHRAPPPRAAASRAAPLHRAPPAATRRPTARCVVSPRALPGQRDPRGRPTKSLPRAHRAAVRPSACADALRTEREASGHAGRDAGAGCAQHDGARWRRGQRRRRCTRLLAAAQRRGGARRGGTSVAGGGGGAGEASQGVEAQAQTVREREQRPPAVGC